MNCNLIDQRHTVYHTHHILGDYGSHIDHPIFTGQHLVVHAEHGGPGRGANQEVSCSLGFTCSLAHSHRRESMGNEDTMV